MTGFTGMQYARLILFFLSTSSLVVAGDERNYFPSIPGTEVAFKMVDENAYVLQTGHQRVGGVVERGGKRYIRSKIWSNHRAGKTITTSLERQDEHGVYEIFGDAKREEMVLPLPITVGATWTWESADRRYKNKLIGIEVVKIGGTRYTHCVHVHGVRVDNLRSNEILDSWIAPGIGTVKVVIMQDYTSPMRRRVRLIWTHSIVSFRLGGEASHIL